MTLYELTKEYQELLDLLEDEDTPDEAVEDTLSMIIEDIDDKAEGYCEVMKSLQAHAEILKKEKQRLAAKQSSLEKRVERMRGKLLYAMLLTGRKAIKTPLFSISARQTHSLIVDVPETELPDEFKKVTVTADKDAMKSFMRDNGIFCTSFAHWEPVDSLVVR